MDIGSVKRLFGEEIWRRLETERSAGFPLPCCGRIPNFAGSEEAAWRVRFLTEWKDAKVIFANPDFAQRKVRE